MIDTGILKANLLGPIPLAFILGGFSRIIKSNFSLPKQLYASLTIYLLFSIGLKGGYELSHASFQEISLPLFATLLIGLITPITSFFIAKKLFGFSHLDATSMAAHYGSVSAVTFIAAGQFIQHTGVPVEGFMPTLLAVLESPGILVALVIGSLDSSSGEKMSPGKLGEIIREIVSGPTIILLLGGILIGYTSGETGWNGISPFFQAGFKGALMLFILEMGIVAADKGRDLLSAGKSMILFGTMMPLLHGALGVVIGKAFGLSLGGTTIFATMASSASYIAAPSAIKLAFPDRNHSIPLTSALAITFPFNILVGIPAYYHLATLLFK